MARRVLFLIIFILPLFINTNADSRKTWNHPLVEKNPYNLNYSLFFPRLEILKVEFNDTATILDAEAQYRWEYIYGLGSDAYLKTTEGNKFLFQKAEGLEIGDSTRVKTTRPIRFRMFFEPLPEEAEKFDFIQKRFQIYGISNGDDIRRQIMSSDWYDIKNGTWIIGIYPEGVIYDNRFWHYTDSVPNQKRLKFNITDGNKTVNVEIGKLHKGKRSFKISGKKFECAMIEDRFLPINPKPDNLTALINTGYKSGDSITVTGWLRNMPEWLKKKSENYSISPLGDLFSQSTGNGKIDSLGFVTIKMPLLNSALFSMDWTHTFMRNVLEPGKEYFFLHDYDTGRLLWMGQDARLQNELCIYPPSWASFPKYNDDNMGSDEYLDELDKRLTRAKEELDSICKENPNLSKRFRAVSEDILKCNFAYDLGQSRFYTIPRGLSDTILNYAYIHFLKEPPTSVMLGYYPAFIKDFTAVKLKSQQFIPYESIMNVMLETDIEDSQKNLFIKADSIKRHWDPIIESQTDSVYKKFLIDSVENIVDTFIKPLNEDKRITKIISQAVESLTLRHRLAQLDSLSLSADIRNIWLAQEILSYLGYTNSSLEEPLISLAKTEITLPVALEAIDRRNNELSVGT